MALTAAIHLAVNGQEERATGNAKALPPQLSFSPAAVTTLGVESRRVRPPSCSASRASRCAPMALLAILLSPIPSRALHPNHPLGFDPERSYQPGTADLDVIDLVGRRLGGRVCVKGARCSPTTRPERLAVLVTSTSVTPACRR